MSIIAVAVPIRCSLKIVVKNLAPIILGHFETLNFHKPDEKKNKLFNNFQHVCYIRLSEKLDPLDVVEKLNAVPKYGKFKGWGGAFIPEHVPDLALASKLRKIPKTLQRKLRLYPLPGTPKETLIKAHNEILSELQYKYTGLFNLSKKLGHKLMISITCTIFDRLAELLPNLSQDDMTSFKLTKAYRKAHPHFADFQFILSKLHKIEDEISKPRTQIVESELMKVSAVPLTIDNVPFNHIRTGCHKYAGRIGQVLRNHVKELQCETNPDDSEEEIARKKIRTELVNMAPYMQTIVKQVLLKNLIPIQPDTCPMRIYGDPILPVKEILLEFLKKYKVFKVMRSDSMYNLLQFVMNRSQLNDLMALDGCVVGGSKLIIRNSHIPKFPSKETMLMKMKEYYGDKSEKAYLELIESLNSVK